MSPDDRAAYEAQRKATEQLREFTRNLDRADDNVGRISSSSSRGGGASIGGVMSQLRTASIALSAFGSALAEVNPLLGDLGTKVGGSLRELASVAQIVQGTIGGTVGQVDRFAQAGVDIPDEVIDRLNSVNLARQRRSARVRARVEGSFVEVAAREGYEITDEAARAFRLGGAGS